MSLRKARSPTGMVEGPLGRMPLRWLCVVGKDRTVGAIVLVMAIDIGLDRPEVWQDFIKASLLVATCAPAIKIIREASAALAEPAPTMMTSYFTTALLPLCPGPPGVVRAL